MRRAVASSMVFSAISHAGVLDSFVDLGLAIRLCMRTDLRHYLPDDMGNLPFSATTPGPGTGDCGFDSLFC